MKNTIIIVLIAGLGAFFAYHQWKKGGESAEAEAAAQRQLTAPVKTMDINFTVTVAGEITPKEEVSVRPEVNGRIKELPVDVGDRVKEGELLFSLDDKDLQIEIASMQTEIESAKLQLEKAKRDFDRDQQLYTENLVSREVFDDTRTQYDLALNAIQRADRALDLVKDRLSKTRIEAPFDCTVLTRPVTGVGQAVSGSGGFNSGTEVMTIANLDEMVVNAHVNQVDVARMQEGQEVQVQIEAVSGLRVDGLIERIAPQATIKNNVKGFAARILITGTDPRIQPGMTANVVIPVSSSDDVLAAPLSSIFTEFNPETGRNERFVYLKAGERFDKRPVRIGVADFFHVEILEGLEEGAVVALEAPPKDKINMPEGMGGPPTQGPANGARGGGA